MLTPPELSQHHLFARLHEAYGLDVTHAIFLPVGADIDSAVYRVTAADGTSYLLKLRRGAFRAASVTVPEYFRRALGLDAVMAPLSTTDHDLWISAEGFHWMLYPFVEGVDGFHRTLSDEHWVKLGACMRAIHHAALPAEMRAQLPREDHAPHARDLLRRLRAQRDQRMDEDPIARQLTAFWQARHDAIETMLDRAEQLARALADRDADVVPCHADLHAGNVLIGTDDALFIVDWDTLILAPRERDLMFVGGGVGGVWNSAREESLFYRGYGPAELDRVALAYYRYQRIAVDIAEACEQIYGARGSLEDRRQVLQQTLDQFLPGNVVEIAHRTYRQIP